MDNACDVVRDLLPLYVDGVCSDASRRMIEEHIKTCPGCGRMLAQLRDSACEDSLRRETAAVLAPRRWRNRAFATSCALAAFVCLPACLAAVLGRGPGEDYPLSWLLLLAPSLLVVLAATLLPLRCRRYTGRWTLLGYTASLLLLMMACCVYTAAGAESAGPELILFAAGTAALYIASAVVILPWVLRELPLRGRFAGKRRMAAAVWDGVFALLVCECAALAAPGTQPAVLIAGMAALAATAAAAVVILLRGLRMDRMARAGICVAVAGNAWGWFAQALERLAGKEQGLEGLCRQGTVIVLIAATAAGGALAAAGAWRAYRRSVRK